jgi:hypothetical protein
MAATPQTVLKEERMIKAGTLLALETGEYSDYGVEGFYRVLKDFDGKELMRQYLAEHPEQAEAYSGHTYEFSAWLSKSGFIEDIDYLRWHIGSYGCFDTESEPK